MRSFNTTIIATVLTAAIGLPLLVLSSGAERTDATPAEVAAFIDAARWGRLDEVRAALADGLDVDVRDDDGITALRWAAVDGQVAVVALLIEAGADVDAADGDGGTSLMVAARWGHADIVAELLAAGADIDARSSLGAGRTALMYAAIQGHEDILEQLLAAGADPSVRDGHGNSAADLARAWDRAAVASRLESADAETQAVRGD